jgi:hypothetical protein
MHSFYYHMFAKKIIKYEIFNQINKLKMQKKELNFPFF